MNRRRPKSEKVLTKRASTTSHVGILEAARNNDIEQINTALRNGDDINTQDENGNTALHQSAMFNLYDVMAYLIYMGADPEIRNKEGVAVVDACRNDDMKSFLGATKQLTIREEYGKLDEDVKCLKDDKEVTFSSSHVTIKCPTVTEGEVMTLRCRSGRLEHVAWGCVDVGDAACSENYIICTNKTQNIDNCDVEIPIFNLPNLSEEVFIRTNPKTINTDIAVYERNRASFCKFKTALPPVLSIIAVCRQQKEVFNITQESRHLVSEEDNRVSVTVPENVVKTPGELKLQVHNITEYHAMFKRFGVELVTPVIELRSDSLQLSGNLDITLPLVDNNYTSTDVEVASLTDAKGEISMSKCDFHNEHKSLTVQHPPKGVLAGIHPIDPTSNNTHDIKKMLQCILNKTYPIQFQIGSKQRRDQQKRCKIIITCSPEEEVDTTVEFWERDGFHFQWCTETYKSTTGETFLITLSSSTVFINGQNEELLQFHPRRRNYVVCEVMSNDVLSNVSLSNVDVRPTHSVLKPDITHNLPLKKTVYIRKTNTDVLEDLSKSDKKEPELQREGSNISDKNSTNKKKKKTTLLRKLSRENTKEMKLSDREDTFVGVNNIQGIICENENKESLQKDINENRIVNVDESKEGDSVNVKVNRNDGQKQKEVTNISSESLNGSLTSLDIEDGGKTTRVVNKKGNKVTSVFHIDSKTNTVLKEGSIVTSDRPVTVRSIVIENLAAFLPVEKTFFSDVYLAVILDEISENWLGIFILMGIPFDVIDVRLTERHGKSRLHDILLQLLKSWRDESSFHVHRGVPLLLSALRKGGKWDLSISVQQRLKTWHDQGLAKEDQMYEWLKQAYTDSDTLIPAEYPRPMSDAFLVMFAPEVLLSHHVTSALFLTSDEYNSVQDNSAYVNDTVKVMKILTIHRSKKTDVVEMLEDIIHMCNQLEFKRASHCIYVSLKGWLNRSAVNDEPLKAGIEVFLSTFTQRSHKSETQDRVLQQRLDVRTALRTLQTPKHKQRREVRSAYGKPSTSS